MVLFLLLFTSLFVFGASNNETEETAKVAATENVGGVNFVTNGALKYDVDLEVAGGQEVTIHFWDAHGANAWWDKWAGEYMKLHPNVTIVWNTYDNSHPEKLLLALRDGNDIDLYYPHTQHQANDIPFTEPFTKEMVDYYSQEFTFVDETKVDGELYYLTPGVMTGGLCINTEIWEEEGLTDADIPGTWTELMELGERLTVKDDAGNITRYGFNGVNHGIWGSIRYQQGEYLFDDNGKVNLDTEASLVGAQFLYDMINKYTVEPTLNVPEAFTAGNLAITYQWGWRDSWFAQNAPDLKYFWAPVPVWDDTITPPARGRNNVELLLSVAKNTSDINKEVAFDIIKYLASNEDSMVEFCTTYGIVPMIKQLEKHPGLEGFCGDNISPIIGRTVWPGPFPGTVAKSFKVIGEKIWNGGMSPEEAIKEAQKVADFEVGNWEPEWERNYAYNSEMN